jgi:1-acyl-sn-glycerol-3-phosphate acyltransferase
MTYRFFRWIAGIMLHWFYSDIQVLGAEQIPSTGRRAAETIERRILSRSGRAKPGAQSGRLP